ncbi:MAG: POTRA domain-containing protein [Cyanobacteria bacterium P01_G01_bin.39]
MIKEIKVLGNTVLQSEIDEIVKDSRLKYRTATFEDLVCLRSRISQLYIDKGYVTSGAFLVNNQDLSNGIVTIQVVEGELEEIVITGLERLPESYLRSRLQLAAQKPLNKDDLETELQLLVLNPLFKTVDAELIAGQKAGSNVLLLDIEQANSFTTSIGVDNYRAPSIGEFQGSVSLGHGNLLGIGDRFSLSTVLLRDWISITPAILFLGMSMMAQLALVMTIVIAKLSKKNFSISISIAKPRLMVLTCVNL